MNEGVISRMARVEVTKKLRAAYRVGSKKEKSGVKRQNVFLLVCRD